MYSETQSSSFNLESEVSPATKSSVSLIPGEYVRFTGKCVEGILTLTNYRLLLQYVNGIYSVTLGVIDSTEIRKVLCLHVYGKDARSYKCTFDTSDLCLDWQKKICESTICPINLEQIFASILCRSMENENPDLHNVLNSCQKLYISRSNKIFDDEVKRLGFDIHGAWKISKANEHYDLCPSYPRRLIVPSSISDKTLEAASKFRASRRIPTPVWRHTNGAVISRSSQPEVGWLWWRSGEDEDIVKALAEACAYDSPPSATNLQSPPSLAAGDCSVNDSIASESSVSMLNGTGNSESAQSPVDMSSLCHLPDSKSQKDIKRLLIMDARSYATAVANRARGGGVECLEYYPMCEIQFMNLDNIHTIRKSHHALRNVVTLPSDIPNWLTLLESTRWFYHMSGLIRSAVTVARTIAIEGRPVLVHCSDGWDRTPQITALAEVLLDPYYRTMEGFRVLIEREWIEFGHKFSDRCGSGVNGSDDLNERCPIFIQWVDCIFQIQQQFPTAFQFNQAYLVKLVQHVYSNMFETFLFNSSRERYLNETQGSKGGAMYSIWPFLKLNQNQYVNLLYEHSDRVLYPSFHTKDLLLWKAIYTDNQSHNPEVKLLQTDEFSPTAKVQVDDVPPPSGDLIKTKSCDSLLEQSPTTSVSMATRRSSDPNLSESLTEADLVECKDDPENEQKRRVSLDELTSANSHETGRVPLNCKKKSSDSPEITDTKTLLEIAAEDCSSESPCDTLIKIKDLELTPVRSNEGSTDTLVAEAGACISEKHSSDVKTPQSNKLSANSPKGVIQGADNKATQEAINGKSLVKNPKEKNPDEPSCFHALPPTSVSSQICVLCRRVWSEAADFKRQSSASEASTSSSGASSSQRSRMASFLTRYTFANEDRMLQPQEESSSFSDGLPHYTDEVTQRLNKIHLQHQIEIESLKRELRATKSFYLHYIQSKLNQSNNNNEGNVEDQDSLPESVGSGSGESGPESSVLSDTSWEAVEEGDAKTTLWVPDHAVDACMNCQSKFWIGRRKHHCRSCGKIFCADCSPNSLPVPKENLYNPVRVCGSCFTSFLELDPKCFQIMAN